MSRLNSQDLENITTSLSEISNHLYNGSDTSEDALKLYTISKNLLFEIYMLNVERGVKDG